MKKSIILSIWTLLGINAIFAQGFINLNFEAANLSSYGDGSVPSGNAIPGWTAYIGGTVQTNIDYDIGIGTFGSFVDVIGTNSDYPAIQGNYYIYLQGSEDEPASIGQIGTIPIMAQYLIFSGLFLEGATISVVSFDGHRLSLEVTDPSDGSLFGTYEANISAYAGQTGQLLFTSASLPYAGGDFIDNIQFLTTPVPEPSPSWLVLLGGGVFLYVHRIFQH